MRQSGRLRSALVSCSGAAALVGLAPAASAEQPAWVQGGEAGFVVSGINYAMAEDADKTGACPQGMVEGYKNGGDVFIARGDLQRKPGEKEDAYTQRLFQAAFTDDGPKNLCQNPELGKPDPRYRVVTNPNVKVWGINLDGVDSKASDGPAPGYCAHADFAGMNGEKGVDNQFYRINGCQIQWQSTGQNQGFEEEMLTGSWGILVRLRGVDDIQNDDDIEVDVFSNADPIMLSPGREPLEYATYSIDQDTAYQAKTKGKIVNGVLTTEPVDMQFHWIVNSIRLDRPIKHARFQMTVSKDGVVEGYLGGYEPVEDLYDYMYGFRDGKDGSGELAPLRLRAGSAIGKSRVQTYTCEGVYFAMKKYADGDPDPETGECTSISTQYRIKLIPAFVDETVSKSLNDGLAANENKLRANAAQGQNQ